MCEVSQELSIKEDHHCVEFELTKDNLTTSHLKREVTPEVTTYNSRYKDSKRRTIGEASKANSELAS